MTAAEAIKAKKQAVRKRTHLPTPKDVDQLFALGPRDIDRIYYESVIRLGRVKQSRSFLLQSKDPSDVELAYVNGKIAWLGSLICVLTARRTHFRIKRRHAIGAMPERAEAIARACDSILPKQLHQRVQEEADRLMAQAAADLAAQP